MAYENDRNPFTAMRHDRMTAWACVNAIMAFLGQPEVRYGEWRDSIDGETSHIDPVKIAHRIVKWRRESALIRATAA